jgi:hypothetical protein
MAITAAMLEADPGPDLATTVLKTDPSSLSRAEAMILVEVAARVTRAMAAVEAALMVAAAGSEPTSDTPGETDRDGAPLDEAGEELAMMLGGSRNFVLNRLELARYLLARLPRTHEAMAAGKFGWYEADLVRRAAEQLADPDAIAELERRLVSRGTQDLARWLRRTVARLDPEAIRRKADQKRSERHVRWWRDRDDAGGATLRAEGPNHLVAMVAEAVDVEAKEKEPGDCRTIDMRRFDVLVGWAKERLGLPDETRVDAKRKRCSTCGRTGPARVPIAVTMSVNTLLGLAETPGELTGWGRLSAEACRELAADGVFVRWLTQPQTGHLLDLGAETYVPSDRLARYVRARDRVCCTPGCNLPAERCDLDHRIAFDHSIAARAKQAAAAGDRDAAPAQPGPTTRENLGARCRRHHRLKHLEGWDCRLDEHGNTLLEAPSGLTYLSERERHGEDDELTGPEIRDAAA